MNFDPVARSYCWLERLTFGGALQRCRVALIDQLRHATNVLIVGEGDGRFLKEFLRVNTVSKVTVVDSSGEMIRLARARVGENERVHFVPADIREVELSGGEYDLVVTNFFLDCFSEAGIEMIIRNVSTKLADNGRWLWSDFAIPASGVRRQAARCMVGLLYWFFRLTTRLEARKLFDPGRAFQDAGFDSIEQASMRNGLLRSILWRK